MTFPATLCPRCGGHKDRCECAVLRREGMMMAHAECEKLFPPDLESGKGEFLGGYISGLVIAQHAIRALARNPEPL